MLTSMRLASFLLVTLGLSAQILDVGPRVGEIFPQFRLKDQSGVARDLRSLLGANGAVIVFYRSADW